MSSTARRSGVPSGLDHRPGTVLGAPISALAIVLLAGLALRLAIAYLWLPGEGLNSDLRLYKLWAQTLADHDPGGFYSNAGFADYPPGYLWVLWLIGAIGNAFAGVTGGQAVDAIAALVKVPAMAADLAIALLLYHAAREWRGERAGVAAAGLYLFVPVTWYDSALWGQVDAIGALLILGALLLLVRGWSEPAVALAVLATLTKPQYALGLLVIGAVLLRRHLIVPGSGPVPIGPSWLEWKGTRLEGWLARQGPWRLISCALIGLAVGLLVILPFDLPSKAAPGLSGIPVIGSVSGLLAVVGSAAEFYNVLTVNAFNGWAFVGPQPLTGALNGELIWTYDSLQVIGPITAAQLGAAMFLALAILVVATLLLRDDRETLVVGFTLLAVAFFVLPTRVHERYLFSAFATGALLATTSMRWRWWFVVLALTNAANLHAILTLPHVGYGTLGVQGLPLGAMLREPFVVGIIADLHIALFLVLLAYFLRSAAMPAIARRRALPQSAGMAASSPAAVHGHVGRLGSLVGRLEVRSRPRADTLRAIPGARVQASSEPDGPGRLDRQDFAVFLLVVVVVLMTRTYRLDMPRSMYFDERWHATAATEFLQDWRYSLPAELSEITHPHVAKYLIALGLVFAGGDGVSASGSTGQPVTDAAFEPAYRDPKSGALAGDRVLMASGAGLTVASRGALASPKTIAMPGVRTVAVDATDHLILVGTASGAVQRLVSQDLAPFEAGGPPPMPTGLGQVAGSVERLWPLDPGRIAIFDSENRLSVIDSKAGAVIGSLDLPGLRDVVPIGPPGTHQAVLAMPNGLVRIATDTMSQLQGMSISGGATAGTVVDGNDQGRRERDLLPEPMLYVVSGAGTVATFAIAQDGVLVARDAFPMPGVVSDISWDRPTNLLHMLGRRADGGATIYVVEPHGNVVFADASLPFDPSAWVLDVQPNDPANDRQRAIAFAADGRYAAVDVGSHAFAWRLPGVIAGALTAGLLFLLTRVLFRKRSVALVLAPMLVLDGLLFQQSRIAMNDVYVALFAVSGLTLLAFLMHSGATDRRARLELLVGLPTVGVLFGLALASKWVGAYAIGAAILLVLWQSTIGQRVALVLFVGIAGIFGYLAIAREPANILFLLLTLALTATFAALVRSQRRAVPISSPSETQPTFRRGGFVWALVSLTAIPLFVYFISFIPWALSTAGGPQLFPGWPPGHEGQTFVDLQAAMYRYHDEFRFSHGAGSPWWAWPLDLKPLWGYIENFDDGMQATILGTGNPFLIWLSTAAVAIGAWQAWQRRSRALGFVVVVFLALWLPWARIDRVTFNYHYYLALPFAFILLAWVVAELLDRPQRTLVTAARAASLTALALPVLLWAFKGPLCVVGGVDRVDPGAAICALPLTSVALPIALYAVVAVATAFFVVRGGSPRRLVASMALLAVGTSLALYPALSAVALPSGSAWTYQSLLPPWDSTFQFWSNTAAATSVPVLGVGAGIVTLVAALAAVAGGWVAQSSGLGLDTVKNRFQRWSLPRARPPRPVGVEVIAPPPPARTQAHPDRPDPRTSPRVRSAVMPRARSSGRWSAPGLRVTAVVLVGVSFIAALVADRFRGLSGPWLWNFDMSLANYSFAAYFHEALAKGGLPLWQDRIGMGFPLYAEGQIGAFYPPNWLIYQLPPLIALDVARVMHLVLAGVGTGLITLRLSGSRTGAIASVLVAVLCGGIVSKLEWTQVITVYGWMPWVLLPILWRRPGPDLRLVALAGVIWGVQALGGHPPYWVLTGLIAVVILVAQVRTRETIGRIALFGAVSLAIGAVQLIPTLVLTTLSWRAEGVGSAALFEYSATPFDFLAVAFGNAFTPADTAVDLQRSWYPGGSVWATLEVYAFIGLPALLFAVLGLRTRRGRPLLVAALVLVAIPIVGAFRPEIWAAIPGLNSLRHPIRAYLVLDLVLAIAAGIGVARLGRFRDVRLGITVVAVAIAGYGFIAALVSLAPSVFDGIVPTIYPYLQTGQAEVVRRLAIDALIQVFPVGMEVALAVGAILLVRDRSRSPIGRFVAIGLIALPLAVLSPAINQSRPSTDFSLEGTSLLATVRGLAPSQLLMTNEPFYGGFHSQLAGVGEREPHVYTSQFGISLRLESAELLIADLRAAGATSPFARAVGVDTTVDFEGACVGELVASDAQSGATVCRDDQALRPPYWVPTSAVIATVDRSGPFAPDIAIVDPAAAIRGAAPATIVSWDHGGTSVEVDAQEDGYVYLDRSWWPAWQVTVDGQSVSAFSGFGGQLVSVSPGHHVIAERLVPVDALMGFGIGTATAIVLALWEFGFLSRGRATLRVGESRRRVLPAVTDLRLTRFAPIGGGMRMPRAIRLGTRPGARMTLAALALATLVAAIVANRYAGPNGPWLWNFDSAPGNYPLASFFHENLIAGRLPLWDDRLGIGYPRYAEGQIGAFYPPNWLIYLVPPLQALDLSRILHLTLAGLGAGVLALRLAGDRFGAAAAALAAVLCGGIASKLEWTQVVVVFGWMPWVLVPLLWRRSGPSGWHVALAGVVWGIQALGGHPPYWVLTAIAAVAIILAKSPRRQWLAHVAGFGVIGVTVGAVQLLPTILLTAMSGRAGGLAAGDLFQFSATPFDLLGVAFANAFVPTSSPSWDLLRSWYPGGTWAILEAYAYVGLPAFALAGLGLTVRRARPLLAVALVVILIPVIGAFRPSIWAELPFVSGLRHPVRAYLVLDLVVAVAAGVGIAAIRRHRAIRWTAGLAAVAVIWYVAVVGMVVFLPAVFDGLSSGFADPAVPRSFATDALSRPWPLIFELALVGILLVAIKIRPPRPYLEAAALGLVVLPLALFVPAINQTRDIGAFSYDDTSLVQTVRAQSPHRVVSINVPFYGGFPDQLEGGFPDLYVQASLPLRSPTDLLGAIWADPGSPLAPAVGVDTEVVFGGPCVAGTEVAFDRQWNARICHLDNATRPPYWVPADVVIGAPSADGARGFGPVDVTVDPVRMIATAVPATIRSWDTRGAVIDVTATEPGYLYIDRAWWPAWQMAIDGEPVTPLRALSGQLVPIPSGIHVVEQRLLPMEVILGAVVSLSSLVGLSVIRLRSHPLRASYQSQPGFATRYR